MDTLLNCMHFGSTDTLILYYLLYELGLTPIALYWINGKQNHQWTSFTKYFLL